MFYAVAARALAEVMGSAQASDYAETHVRTQVIELLKPGAKPFQTDTEQEPWKDYVFKPAQVTWALKVQAKAAANLASTAPLGVAGAWGTHFKEGVSSQKS